MAFVVVQLLSHVQLFATPWTAECQASLSFTISQSLLKPMSVESVMPSNRIVLYCPLLLLPSIFPSIRVFSNESALCLRWPKYWSFSFSPSSKYSRLISFVWIFILKIYFIQLLIYSVVFISAAQQSDSVIYIYIHILFHILFHMVYHRILNIIFCTIQQGLVVYPF